MNQHSVTAANRRPAPRALTPKCTSFFTFMEAQIASLQSRQRYKTASGYACALRSFRLFRDGRDLLPAELTHVQAAAYESWLRQRGVSLNSTSFYMRILRAVYNRTVACGLTPQRYPFREVYTGICRTRKRAADHRTIARLRQLDLLDTPSLALARDLFLFSFYTRGMSFIDVAFLRKEALHDGIITYRRHKTGQILSVRCEAHILHILERYAPQVAHSPYLLPVLGECDRPHTLMKRYDKQLRLYNRSLSILSARLALPHPLTSYTARHTWATVAKQLQIPISVISEGMGHTSELTTRIYLDSFEQSVLDDANRLIISRC